MQFFPFMNVSAGTGIQDGTPAKSVANAGREIGDSFSTLFDRQRAGVRPEFFQAEGGEEVSTFWDRNRSGLTGLATDAAGRHFTGLSALAAKNGGKDGSDPAADLRAILSGKGTTPKSLKDVSSMKMTREDFAALKKGLKKAGLDDADITALGDKISSAEGLTWGAFVTALSDKLAALGKDGDVQAISNLATRELQSLFQKIGFTVQEGEALISDLRSGKTQSVWDAVGSKLASLPAGATIDLNATELAALGSVAGLSETAGKRLMSLLGGADSATLSAAQLKTVMNTLKSEVAQDSDFAKGSGKQLMTLVNDVLGEATERAETADLANGRPDNSARNSRILAEESRRERAEQNRSGSKAAEDEGTAERILKADPNGAAAKKAAAAVKDPEAAEAGKDTKAKSEAQQLRDAMAARAQKASGESSGSGGEKNAAGEDGLGGRDSEAKKAWNEMWGKVKVDSSAARATVVPPLAGSAEQLAQADAESATDAMFRRWGDNTSGRMMDQVESGLLKNLGEGRKQLTLELNPGDLGKLNVVLQSKDGEVNVMFRAEHQDTGRVLSEQLAQLKTHLENQGIKVGKMEVQTQLQDQNLGQGWQGADKHNLAQEQQNLVEKRGLMRLLRQDAEPVAQELLNDPETARIAQEGLYVVA